MNDILISEISYVLVTAARNEEKYLRETINSVLAQTILPKLWAIVSDKSTDATDAIIKEYSRNCSFLKYIRTEKSEHRNFASKVYAINEAIVYLNNSEIEFEFIGNLDADIRICPGYYERMLNELNEDPRIGIVGGQLWDSLGGKFKRQQNSENSVGGPVQLFRKECWEMVGGYKPMEFGCEDGVAEISARMLGWKVKCLRNVPVHHLRATGTEGKSYWKIRWNEGKICYMIGDSFQFHLFRFLKKFSEKPFFLGNFLMTISYLDSLLKHDARPVSNEFIAFHRKEQRQKARNAIKSVFSKLFFLFSLKI